MGLDITHYKATLERPQVLHPASGNFMTEKEFEEYREEFDVGFDYFKDYIQLIDEPVQLKTIICPKRESEIDEVKTWFKDHEDCVFFV